MSAVLIAQSGGEDTATQLYRDDDGGYRCVVMALSAADEDPPKPEHAARIFSDRPVSHEAALALYRASAAQRFVELSDAFPGYE